MIEITPQQLKAKHDAGESFELIDVRPAHDYQEKHIPGAMNVPAGATFGEEFQKAISDKDAAIVLYNGFKEEASDQESAAALEALGYKNISVLPDGLMGWMNAGFPVEFGRES